MHLVCTCHLVISKYLAVGISDVGKYNDNMTASVAKLAVDVSDRGSNPLQRA